jgi:hypothetical protein
MGVIHPALPPVLRQALDLAGAVPVIVIGIGPVHQGIELGPRGELPVTRCRPVGEAVLAIPEARDDIHRLLAGAYRDEGGVLEPPDVVHVVKDGPITHDTEALVDLPVTVVIEAVHLLKLRGIDGRIVVVAVALFRGEAVRVVVAGLVDPGIAVIIDTIAGLDGTRVD